MRDRSLIALAAAGTLALYVGVGCAYQPPVSAFAPGPWAKQDGNVLTVAYSSGGNDLATLADLLNRHLAGEPIRIDGDCLSACTLALMDVLAGTVCWTERTRFLFHAAHVNGGKDEAATERFASALPAPVRNALPHPAEWRVDRWHELTGKQAHAALGRGYCKEIG